MSTQNRSRTIYQKPRGLEAPGERIVTSSCSLNCGGVCVVNAHVRDGRIVKISTQPGKWDPELPPLYACVRGFAAAEHVNHSDRLKYPMRRTGERGSGEFQRISWDEALDEVAHQMLRIRDTYGPASILNCSHSAGAQCALHNWDLVKRLLYKFGGCTELWGNVSAQAEVFAFQNTFGPYKGGMRPAGREGTDYVNSRLILLWGWTPGDATDNAGTLEYLKWAKGRGTRMVCVDPRITHTSATLADEHIFIRPSTDAAMLIAMAYVIITEELQDQGFLDRSVLGFDEEHLPQDAPAGSSYRSYVLGHSDGVPKTPGWAEGITGVPAATTARLAQEFAANRPAAIHCGRAPGRTAFGEQFHRAAHALAVMTGNVGVPGGNTGTSKGTKLVGLNRGRFLPGNNPTGARVNFAYLADLLARGRAGGYPADIKMVYSASGNLLNQLPNSSKTAAALGGKEIEFVVVHENFMTPTARFADILLPATTAWERNDIRTPTRGHHAVFMKKAIEPMYECRNDLDICTDLAQRLGITGYNDKASDLEWLREFCQGTEIDDFDAFCENGLARLPAPADGVAFAEEIRDPDKHRFATPSGKIEIYSTTLAKKPDLYGLGAIPAIPTYIPPYEADPRFPLQLISPQSRARTHSTHYNQPQLAKIDPQDVWLHPKDAAARGIADGQMVRVFNERGATLLPAKVTDRIARGCVSIKAGAWFTPNAAGEDEGGSANVLTNDRPSPAGAQTYSTCLVEVETAKKT